MNQEDIIAQLEHVGLTKSEGKVYLALLTLGASTTGPIVTKSQTANSKIYEVLEKLMQKGMATKFSKKGTYYYKASSPKNINHYIEEKKQAVQEQQQSMTAILPYLSTLEREGESEKEASIITGARGIKNGFTNIVEELKKGEEVHIMGIYEFSDQYYTLATYFQKIRTAKGVGAKFLMNKKAKDIAKTFLKYPPAEVRFFEEDLLTPSLFIIYKDKVIISIPQDMTWFVLKSKSANIAFNTYFETLWKNAKTISNAV